MSLEESMDPRCLYKALKDLADQELPMRRLGEQREYRAHLTTLADMETRKDLSQWLERWSTKTNRLIRYECTDASNQGVWFDDLVTAASTNEHLSPWATQTRESVYKPIIMGTKQITVVDVHLGFLEWMVTELPDYHPGGNQGPVRRPWKKRRRRGHGGR